MSHNAHILPLSAIIIILDNFLFDSPFSKLINMNINNHLFNILQILHFLKLEVNGSIGYLTCPNSTNVVKDNKQKS